MKKISSYFTALALCSSLISGIFYAFEDDPDERIVKFRVTLSRAD